MKQTKNLKFDYTAWLMKSSANISNRELIKMIHDFGDEYRADFIAKSFRQMVYVVDYYAQSQEDVDDLMTVAVFAVDKVINTLVNKYKQENKLLDETQIHYYVYYTLLRVIQREIKKQNERISKLVSWEKMLKERNFVNAPTIEDFLKWHQTTVEDVEFYDRKELIDFAHDFIKATMKSQKKIKFLKDILKDYFQVDLKTNKEIMEMIELLSAPDYPTLDELAEKYGVSREIIRRRITKVLIAFRRVASNEFKEETQAIKYLI